MKRALAAALLTAAALAVLAPAASASSDPNPVGGVGSGPYIGDVPKPGPGGQ
ncbi:hypothetical protein ACWEGE_02195 [Amycolatopsis sp. NPDC004747]